MFVFGPRSRGREETETWRRRKRKVGIRNYVRPVKPNEIPQLMKMPHPQAMQEGTIPPRTDLIRVIFTTNITPQSTPNRMGVYG